MHTDVCTTCFSFLSLTHTHTHFDELNSMKEPMASDVYTLKIVDAEPHAKVLKGRSASSEMSLNVKYLEKKKNILRFFFQL